MELRRHSESLSPQPMLIERLMDAMQRDKKVRSGKLRFVAMESLGAAATVEDIPEAWIKALWAEVGAQ